MPRLPGTDFDVSDLCLGGNVFGWTADEPTSFALLDRYADATPSTVRPFVDTAESYGDGTSARLAMAETSSALFMRFLSCVAADARERHGGRLHPRTRQEPAGTRHPRTGRGRRGRPADFRRPDSGHRAMPACGLATQGSQEGPETARRPHQSQP